MACVKGGHKANTPFIVARHGCHSRDLIVFFPGENGMGGHEGESASQLERGVL